MEQTLLFNDFCERYDLDESCQDSRRLYRVYLANFTTFNLAISHLVVAEALKKAAAY
ncbi:hypothetical protein [Shewanella sp. NIFS-20-20]|uniref:hypothetical protein n=1 Tax=Shewanella sp. NIFS-20-20 TaxID=2853806 RepID=UPI001C448B8D|nr:hypothetical protein [Shewanella sp. NIFS-20-20]MBV7316073.1 hypothetical protein [Shewanella sp. NIFS-20-20]